NQSETTLINPTESQDSNSINSSNSSRGAAAKRVTVRRRTRERQSNSAPPIIVHCHLCWDWVWQRPQQFLSRLSRRHKVLFVETIGPDPELIAPYARLKRLPDFPNIYILRLQFPNDRWNDGLFIDRERT